MNFGLSDWWLSLSSEAQAAWVQAVGSVAAIFVAIGVAWWQARQARKQQRTQWLQEQEHRKIAVRPHLTIEEFTQRGDPQLQIFLRNTGVGPAIISKFVVKIGGRPLYFERATFWQQFVRALGLPPGVNSGGTVLADGQAIPSASERTLLRYRPADLRQVDNKVLIDALVRVDYEIEYKSIYGEEFHFRSRNTDSSVSFCLGAADGAESIE